MTGITTFHDASHILLNCAGNIFRLYYSAPFSDWPWLCVIILPLLKSVTKDILIGYCPFGVHCFLKGLNKKVKYNSTFYMFSRVSTYLCNMIAST
jgi:hypothetical protein